MVRVRCTRPRTWRRTTTRATAGSWWTRWSMTSPPGCRGTRAARRSCSCTAAMTPQTCSRRSIIRASACPVLRPPRTANHRQMVTCTCKRRAQLRCHVPWMMRQSPIHAVSCHSQTPLTAHEMGTEEISSPPFSARGALRLRRITPPQPSTSAHCVFRAWSFDQTTSRGVSWRMGRLSVHRVLSKQTTHADACKGLGIAASGVGSALRPSKDAEAQRFVKEAGAARSSAVCGCLCVCMCCLNDTMCLRAGSSG